jgi:serine/threonine protein kinase
MSSDPIEKSSMSDFEILKQLCKGAFGSVFLVKRKADNNIYALKSVIMDKLKKKSKKIH